MTKEYSTEELDAARQFAERFQEVRNAHKWTQAQLAQKMGYVRQTITRIESGHHLPTRNFAIRADEALGTGGLFIALLPSPEAERHKLLRRYVHIEQHQATGLFQWQALVVPAMLQTAEYARAVMTVAIPPRGAADIDQYVAYQMGRQNALWRESPLTAHFVISAAAVTQMVGGGTVMLKQWEKLIQWSENPHITLQILPKTVGAHASMQGSYTILEIETLKWALYVETMAGGNVITDAQTVSHARQRFSALMATALRPGESIDFLLDLRKEEVTA
ncbi:helix-turn-helix transcriptional regulator [Nocardiopsis sp. ARC36]